MGWALRFLKQIGTQKEPGVTPYMYQLGPWKQAAGGPMLAQQAYGPTYNALRHLCCHVC